MATIPAGSVEYVTVPVTVTSGDQPVTPTAQYAVLARGTDPVEADWTAAEWVDGSVRFLTDGTRAAGEYAIWVRVADAPEDVRRMAGYLRVD